jgi:spermidine/putrescine-binding protein
MKKMFLKSFLVIGIVISTFSSCTTLNHSMREPNTRVNLNKSDFTLSDQVTATATTTKILGIDFARLFTKKTGVVENGGVAAISLASIPVIGNLIFDKTSNYSLYELMTSNPGYDVVFYPQYETKVLKPVLGIGFITKITTVKTTARLGKLTK